MIKNFKCKETEKVFNRLHPKMFSGVLYRTALKKLLLLEAATLLEELLIPPGNRLEKLVGNRANQYSIRINSQLRVCFEWKEGNAYNVEIVDYHK